MRYDFLSSSTCNMCRSGSRKMIGMRLNASQGLAPRKVPGIAVSVMQCENCALIYPDPLPKPENMSDHYGVPPEEYWRNTSPWTSDYFSSQIATVKRLLPFREGMSALDIGAGRGLGMASIAHAGFEPTGIEASVPFRDHAIRESGIEPKRLFLTSIEDAHFEPESFDFINFGAVLEHLYDPDAALRQALQWLRPGGIIHVEVPSSGHLITRILNRFFRLRGTNYVSHISPMHTPFHIYEFSHRSFTENGLRNGYEVAEHQIDVCEIAHVPGVLHPIFRWWMNRSKQGMQLVVYLRKLHPPRASPDIMAAQPK